MSSFERSRGKRSNLNFERTARAFDESAVPAHNLAAKKEVKRVAKKVRTTPVGRTRAIPVETIPEATGEGKRARRLPRARPWTTPKCWRTTPT